MGTTFTKEKRIFVTNNYKRQFNLISMKHHPFIFLLGALLTLPGPLMRRIIPDLPVPIIDKGIIFLLGCSLLTVVSLCKS